MISLISTCNGWTKPWSPHCVMCKKCDTKFKFLPPKSFLREGGGGEMIGGGYKFFLKMRVNLKIFLGRLNWFMQALSDPIKSLFWLKYLKANQKYSFWAVKQWGSLTVSKQKMSSTMPKSDDFRHHWITLLAPKNNSAKKWSVVQQSQKLTVFGWVK